MIREVRTFMEDSKGRFVTQDETGDELEFLQDGNAGRGYLV